MTTNVYAGKQDLPAIRRLMEKLEDEVTNATIVTTYRRLYKERAAARPTPSPRPWGTGTPASS